MAGFFVEHGQKIRNSSTSIGIKWEWKQPVLPEPEINGRKGLIIRKPDDAEVLIYLTDLVKKKESYQRHRLKFNETIRQHVSEEKIKPFIEV
jgi:hypothetical protein